MDPEITAQRFGRVVYFEDRVQNQSCEVPRSPLMQSADTAKYIYTDNIHNITSLPLVLKTHGNRKGGRTYLIAVQKQE